jgi:hypothetical protein
MSVASVVNQMRAARAWFSVRKLGRSIMTKTPTRPTRRT